MGKTKPSPKATGASKPSTTPGKPKRSIDFKWVPIDELVPSPWNPNTEDDVTFNLLQDEIAEVGLIDPIEVVPLEDGSYRIIGGEHRWRACKNLGHEEIACVLLTDTKWTDVDLQKFVTVRLNVLRGKLDPDKFLALYNEMATKYGEEAMQRLMGYADSKAFQKMLGWVKKGLKQSLPKEMAQQVDDATKEVKSVADLENIIQDLFNTYGETVNHTFMVFTYGRQQHVYLQMNAKMRQAMNRAMECCKQLKMDLNDFMLPLVDELTKKAALEIEKNKREVTSETSKLAVEKAEW